ncbi:RusA family crossover junction endodeoxyribonuclease [Acinetobacter baumannii]|uniref:RusA family crossover junction endodeoxyribonuclease n=1 Tax=Acinetobacter baumannii TaxID=470 RepID=UPI00145A588F|nr:RusA family crossover junction endodeoxyribonuclease [Acinetobacter baumannii]MCA4383991.1 RusA family crossover junction endodeoxyribonuclease [Acinetobacter baumannii]QJF31823.1 RusA family crossover junction endodeoxyribonuclease [Acinetobacter baumannii]QJF35162.1 RusA family crossover junction endodeoxyribonuclease [Acinetobacter baumannii]QJF36417.1 RusA family crossover junction endodeoxyribonuclease [Acinetobacter baumannii]HCG3398455.1 RusA family crossover junction endodeoxyribonu
MASCSNRRQWSGFFTNNKRQELFKDFSVSVVNDKPKKQKTSSSKHVFFPCRVEKEIDGENSIYSGSTGGVIISGKQYITIKLPYGLSANEIWRATIDQNGKQRNSLSVGAKKYKDKVQKQYGPMFRALKLKAIDQLCEIRLIVQPPLKTRSYSAKTYPRFDIDNYPKLLIDSVKGDGLLFKDDNIFISEQIKLAEPCEEGCVWLSCVFTDETDWLSKTVDFDWLAGRSI